MVTTATLDSPLWTRNMRRGAQRIVVSGCAQPEDVKKAALTQGSMDTCRSHSTRRRSSGFSRRPVPISRSGPQLGASMNYSTH